MTVRTFLAFDTPAWVSSALGTLITDLRKYDEDVQWTTDEKFHVTMRFFGEIDEKASHEDLSAAIESVTARAKPVAVECAGVGVFPNWKYPRVIWAGFSGETEPLLQLHDDLNEAFSHLDDVPDERAFRLHLTIGRAKGLKGKCPLVKRVESLGPMSFGEMTIDHLILYKSQLTKDGAIYTPIEQFNLG
jgi:RNA 2',3'-cyclic 3'-phosphodiesterase